MINIILDTNIILRQPKLLGLQIPETLFLVPRDVIEELNIRANLRGASFDSRLDLIEKASQQGTVSIVNVDPDTLRKHQELLSSKKISGADISIIAIALNLIDKGEIVKIATLDREISKISTQYKIEILSDIDLTTLLNKFVNPARSYISFLGKFILILFSDFLIIPSVVSFTIFQKIFAFFLFKFFKPKPADTTVQNEIVTYEIKEITKFFKGVLTGIILTLISILIYNNLDKIISTITIWGTILLILFLGIGLFVIRERKRLGYGIFEFLVGILAIVLLFLPDEFNYSKLNINLDFSIKFFGGLYIMVRGQDNIVRSQKDTKIGLYLKDKFGIGK